MCSGHMVSAGHYNCRSGGIVAAAYKQKEKSKQTRDELMASAVELFTRKGFAAATIAEITDRAGYAKGSFYRHWSSKNDLFLEILEQKLQAYRAAREQHIKDAQSLTDVMEVIWDFLETMMQDANWARNYLEFAIHAGADPELKEQLANRRYRLSDALFAELVSPFVNTDFPPEKMGALNTALFEGFLIHKLLGFGTLDAADVRQAALALVHVLGCREHAPCLSEKIKQVEDP